jgi:hypothetical protein
MLLAASPLQKTGGFMRLLACLLLLSCQLLAQNVTRETSAGSGTFFVDGVLYQYSAAANCTVVAAVHSVLNHKFLAVKVRVYNAGQHSISVRPDDVVVEDAVSGREVTAVSASELARRMRLTTWRVSPSPAMEVNPRRRPAT